MKKIRLTRNETINIVLALDMIEEPEDMETATHKERLINWSSLKSGIAKLQKRIDEDRI